MEQQRSNSAGMTSKRLSVNDSQNPLLVVWLYLPAYKPIDGNDDNDCFNMPAFTERQI